MVKWRWGADADGLLVKGAPSGIKFALGENPTRSNSGFFPRRRAALPDQPDGRRAGDSRKVPCGQGLPASQKKAGEPIRPDYQLEALGEILEGKRLVHSHSYPRRRDSSC